MLLIIKLLTSCICKVSHSSNDHTAPEKVFTHTSHLAAQESKTLYSFKKFKVHSKWIGFEIVLPYVKYKYEQISGVTPNNALKQRKEGHLKKRDTKRYQCWLFIGEQTRRKTRKPSSKATVPCNVSAVGWVTVNARLQKLVMWFSDRADVSAKFTEASRQSSRDIDHVGWRSHSSELISVLLIGPQNVAGRFYLYFLTTEA